MCMTYSTMCMTYSKKCMPYSTMCMTYSTMCMTYSTMCMTYSTMCMTYSTMCMTYSKKCMPYSTMCITMFNDTICIYYLCTFLIDWHDAKTVITNYNITYYYIDKCEGGVQVINVTHSLIYTNYFL